MKRIALLLPLILLVHLSLLALLRFTAWPEMTLWPYLVNQGWLQYRDIAMAHNPLLIFNLAFFYKLFGLSLLNLKVFTWVLILLTDLLVYFVAFRLTKNRFFALLSLIFYVLWQPFFEGNGLWFDLALTLPAFLTFHFLWTKKFFWAGLFLGLAILVKQTAIWFIVPLIGQVWLTRQTNKEDLTKLIMGGVIPLLGLVSYFLFTGILADFYFWAINFGIFYLPHASGQVELPTIKQIFALVVPFALILPSLFLKKDRKLILMLVIWSFFASLGIFPRWSLFHLQPSLPFLAMISGIALGSICGAERHKIRLVTVMFIFLVMVSLGTVYFQARFYRLNWGQPDRFFEKETIEMAQWLKNNTVLGQKIFIINSWDHLYALSGTLPSTRPWVPTLPWYLEYPGIQDRIVADLNQNKPRFVVFEPYKNEGLGSYKPEKIDKFLSVNYKLKEIIGKRFQVLELR